MSQKRVRPFEDGSQIGTCHLSGIEREDWETNGYRSIELDGFVFERPRRKPPARKRYYADGREAQIVRRQSSEQDPIVPKKVKK